MARLDNSKTRIPPLPLFIVLTDLDDGTEWVLSHNADLSRVSINDQGLARGSLPPYQDVVIYPAGEGPYLVAHDIVDYQLTLIVRGGRLGYRREPLPKGQVHGKSAPVYTRRGVTRSFNRIQVPTTRTWHPYWAARGDESLAYERVDL